MHGDFGDVGMRGKGSLHFKTGNVFTAAPHVVLFAVNEIEETVIVKLAYVSSMTPHVAHDFQRV